MLESKEIQDIKSNTEIYIKIYDRVVKLWKKIN